MMSSTEDSLFRERLTSVYTANLDQLVAFAEKYVKEQHAAKNMASDAFYKLFHKPVKLNDDTKLKTVLFTTVKNLCIDYIRFREHDRKINDYPPINPDIINVEAFNTDYSREEKIATVHRQLNKLKGRRRQVARLLLEKEWDTGEVAKRLGISEVTVRNTKKWIIDYLKRTMKRD